MKTVSEWQVRKQLAMLVAYQLANLTMLLGFFMILFLLARHLGVL